MSPTATLAFSEMGTARNNSFFSPPDYRLLAPGNNAYDNE